MFRVPEKLFQKIGFSLESEDLLKEAFTHRSAVNEYSGIRRHNERLEFLGDAVLELITTDFLFNMMPNRPEGELTNIRSALVRGEHLAHVARNLEMGQYLVLSKGEERSGGKEKDYLLANLVEAFIGAVYIEKGIVVVKDFIAEFILSDLDSILKARDYIDSKSEFQEFVQEKVGVTPYYQVQSESGLDHEKTFIINAFVGDLNVGEGIGKSKKEAQSKAAENALSNKKEWIDKIST